MAVCCVPGCLLYVREEYLRGCLRAKSKQRAAEKRVSPLETFTLLFIAPVYMFNNADDSARTRARAHTHTHAHTQTYGYVIACVRVRSGLRRVRVNVRTRRILSYASTPKSSSPSSSSSSSSSCVSVRNCGRPFVSVSAVFVFISYKHRFTFGRHVFVAAQICSRGSTYRYHYLVNNAAQTNGVLKRVSSSRVRLYTYIYI